MRESRSLATSKIRLVCKVRTSEIIQETYQNSHGPTPTVAAAVYDMYRRGFSSESIAEDMDILGITSFNPYDMKNSNHPVYPLSHYPLCKNRI